MIIETQILSTPDEMWSDTELALFPFPVMDELVDTIPDHSIDVLVNYITSLSLHALLIDPTNAEDVLAVIDNDVPCSRQELHDLYNENFNDDAKSLLVKYDIYSAVDTFMDWVDDEVARVD
jgi:hypothetical protein